MSKRGTKKKSFFGIGLLIYFLVGCIGIIFFLRWFKGYLIAYESALPSNGITEVMDAFKTGTIETVMSADNLVSDSTYYNIFDYEAHIRDMIRGKEITIDGETMANPAGSFLFYAGIALLGIVWGLFFMPETKGKSLEGIEKHWREGGAPRTLK